MTGEDVSTWPQWIKRIQPHAPLVQILLHFPDKDILEVAEDIYCGQYQLAQSTFSHWHLDLLMQELHDDLDQRLVRLAFAILQTQAGPNPGAKHAPMPLSGPTPCHELGHCHQKPTGGKAPQSHSSVDAALCEPVGSSPQALCGA